MEIAEEVRAAHRDLSPVASRFLDYALAHPEAGRSIDLRRDLRVPEWLRALYAFPLQPWPVFAGAAKIAEITRATVGIVKLVRAIPERVFDNDAGRIAAFYGWDDELLTGFLLEPPNGLASAVTRCDFVGGEGGLKCVEVNGSANIGGWQLRFFERVCRDNPALAPFFAAAPELAPVYRDPWEAVFSHVVRDTRRAGIAGAGEINVAVMASATAPAHAELRRSLGDLYSRVLAKDGAPGGELLVYTDNDELAPRGTELWMRGRRVHAVLEYMGKQTPPHVYRSFKSGSTALYNGPLGPLLGDKCNLALLSELEESDLLSAAERAVVRDHVPWSRTVADVRTTFQGEPVSLLEFATARRESLVLKPAYNHSGNDVYIGIDTEPAEWEAKLREAAGGRRTLVQEYVQSRPYLLQHGQEGCALHDLVWGSFCFGEDYGGGFLRVSARGEGPRVINSARGATEGFIFEV